MQHIESFFNDIKHGIIEVFASPSKVENIYSLNGRVPFGKAFLFGVQHVLTMFTANVVPYILVFAFLNEIDSSFAVHALQNGFFVAGIGTIIQLLLGARLPLVVGTSFTFVTVFITIISDVTASGGTQLDAYYTLMGAIFIGSILMGIISCFYKY